MAQQGDRWGAHRDSRVYWGSLCLNLGASCVHYTIQGMRGDPLGVLSSSSGPPLDDSESYTSDVTHDSPRTSTTNALSVLPRNSGSSRQAFQLGAAGAGRSPSRDEGFVQAFGASATGGVPTLSGLVSTELGSGSAKCGSSVGALKVCGLGFDPCQGGDHACLGHCGRSCAPVSPGSKLWRIVHEPMFCARMALMIMVTLLILGFSAAAYYTASFELKKSVSSVGAAIHEEVFLAAQSSFEKAIEVNTASARTLSRFISSSVPAVQSLSDHRFLLDKVAPYLWIAHSSRPDTGLVGFLASTGEFFGYTNSHNTSLVYARSSGVSDLSVPQSCITPNSFDWFYQPVNQSNGQPTNVSAPLDCFLYVPKLSVLQLALNDSMGRAFWTTSMTIDGDLLLLSMQAVMLPGFQSPAGVVMTSMSLSSVSQLIGKQNLFGGDFYVIDDEGDLVIQTGSRRPTAVAPQQQVRAEFSNNPLVAAASQYLDRQLGNISSLSAEPHCVPSARINGTHYSIGSSPLDPICKCLVAVFVLPRNRIPGNAGKGVHKLLIVYAILAVALILVAWFLVLLLTRGVSAAMEKEQSYIAQVKAVKWVEKRTHHKHQFFANMSHDLRTPLAAIIGLIDMILSDNASIASDLEASMVQMKSCANSLLGIMNSILDLSNLEGGKLESNPCDFDLVSILEEVVNTFAVVGLKKEVEVVLELPDDNIETCRWVHGDPRHVKQVISNLLSNSVKFTREGGHAIVRVWPKPFFRPLDDSLAAHHDGWLKRTVCAPIFRCSKSLASDSRNRSSVAQDSIEYEFEVDDTGIGIPPSRREAVFQNFVQASSKVHRIHGGTGLGLAIVRSLVHVMGGHIWVADKQEPGTLIKFDLIFQKPAREVAQPRGARRFFIKGRESSADNFRNNESLRPLTLAQHLVKDDNRLSVSTRKEEADVNVLLAMQGKVGKQLVYTWMEKRGAIVWDVPEWNDISPTFRCIISGMFNHASPQSSPQSHCYISPRSSYRQASPSRFSPPRISSSSVPEGYRTNAQEPGPLVIALIDVALIPQGKEFQPSRFRSELESYRRSCNSHGYFLHIVWIVSPDALVAASAAWQCLRSRCDSTLLKPVHESRLVGLDEEINSRYRKEMAMEKRRSSFIMRPPSPSRINSTSVGPGQEPMVAAASPRREVTEGMPSQLVVPAVNKHSPDREGERPSLNAAAAAASSWGNAGIDHVQLEMIDVEVSEVGTSVAASRSPEKETKAKALVSQKGAKLAGLRILLVEDTAVMQMIASQMLRKEGALVQVARDGKEAVDMVALTLSPAEPRDSTNTTSPERPEKAGPYDLVLMDCQMPVMDGYTATARIREMEQGKQVHLPIVALTAHGGMMSDQQKCMDAGMDAYIAKPLQLDTLLAAMTQLNMSTTNKEA